MDKAVVLHNFKSVLPTFHRSQMEIVDWIIKAHSRTDAVNGIQNELSQDKLKRYVLSEKYIKQRYFECQDLSFDWEEHAIYRLTSKEPQGVDIEERNRFYALCVEQVFQKLYGDYIPEHLIHVSCTGYVSPSPGQVYFSKKMRSPEITHAYHMGCYASMPAIRMAQAWNHFHQKEIDIVHNELCSLHLDTASHSPEQMVVQSLFADGHIKYSLSSSISRGFLIKVIKEKLIPDSMTDMTWIPGAHGMRMTLSREVPLKIRNCIRPFVESLAEISQIPIHELIKNGIFAIHPGGPSIIEAVQKKLELSDEQVRQAKYVLRERGNMSSATLPHVWQRIWEEEFPSGTPVVSLAFGPGLSVFGAIFEIRR